ncbi:MAG: bifunctional 4-hydroxy-2-oxoglutarate aldolase/2-dehydro-3-deoxy-phosphogluconate aldolase [Promethearchaeota archaeon]
MRLLQDLEGSKLVAVVAIHDSARAVPLARALLAGGINFIEITFRTNCAAEALNALQSANLGIHVGAGTVRTKEQASSAIAAGSEFIVSPGFNGDVIQLVTNAGIPFFPGVDSTIGIEKAVARGLKILKFFPAGVSGGVKWLKAMKGPYFDIQFIPTGGVTLENMKDYLELPNVIAIGGSFLAPKQLIEEGKFDEITGICRKAREIVKNIKE